MHTVKQIVNISNQIMHYNYPYFSSKYDDNSYARTMFISADSMLIAIDILMQNESGTSSRL